jgi:hypothetical protein
MENRKPPRVAGLGIMVCTVQDRKEEAEPRTPILGKKQAFWPNFSVSRNIFSKSKK